MGNWIRVLLLGVLLTLSLELGSYAHAQNVKWRAGDEVGLAAICHDIDGVEYVAEVAKQDIDKAMEAVYATIETGQCAMLPVMYTFKLQEKMFEFTDADGDILEVWSMTTGKNENTFYYWLLKGHSTRTGYSI